MSPQRSSPRAASPSWWASRWIHGAGLTILALVVWLPFGIYEVPIVRDSAYFTYLAQAILRCEPIYTTTFMGYPPTGLMLSSAAMAVGSLFEVPSWLAPRFLAVGVGVTCCVAVYLLTRRATGNAWAGLVSGVVLASFDLFGRSTLSTLEPKHVVVLLGLATGLALQRRRWGLAGLTSVLAATCWQPAGLVPLAALAVTGWAGRGRLAGALGRYALGTAFGILPTLLYLGLTGTAWDFWMRSVVIQGSWELPLAGSDPTRWLVVVATQYSRDLWLFVAAGTGFAGCAIGAFRRGVHGLGEAWLGAELAAMPLLTLLWAAFNSVDFGNYPDMYPILPCVAFWCGWLCHTVVKVVPSAARLRALPTAPPVRDLVGAALLLAVAAYGLAIPAPNPRRLDLARQQAQVRRILELAGPGHAVTAFSAEEVYVFAGLPTPIRLLRLADGFEPFLHLAGWSDCADLMRGTIERSEVVVVRTTRRSSACGRAVADALARAGYARRFEAMGAAVYQRPAKRDRSS